ncbi:MAG: helix-turn-helix domain-containing protein [Chitinophagaceae bacterium]
MLFEFNMYSSLLLIFFVQALVYAGMLIFKWRQQNQSADAWLAFLLLLAALYVFPWTVGFAGWYDNQPYRDILFYVPFQHLFLIGPVLFMYVRSLLNPAAVFRKRDVWHFLPGILYAGYSLAAYVVDQWVMRQYFFLFSEQDPDFDSWYQAAGLFSFLLYVTVSLVYYRRYKRLLYQWVSNADTYLFRWIQNFLVTFSLVLTLRFFFLLAGLFFEVGYSDAWWYYLLFSVLFYYVAVAGYSNALRGKFGFRLYEAGRKKWLISMDAFDAGKQIEDPQELEGLIWEPQAEVKQESADWSWWKNRLMSAMEQEQLYADPELTLKSLAQHLSTNTSVLSRAINQGFGVNFNDFVNHFRIEEFKRLVEIGEQQRQTLLALAFQCGFNSKATFNRAFRRALSMSPNQYVRSQTSAR